MVVDLESDGGARNSGGGLTVAFAMKARWDFRSSDPYPTIPSWLVAKLERLVSLVFGIQLYGACQGGALFSFTLDGWNGRHSRVRRSSWVQSQ